MALTGRFYVKVWPRHKDTTGFCCLQIPACPWVSSFRGLIVKLLKYGPQFHMLPFKKMDVMDMSFNLFSLKSGNEGSLSPAGMVRNIEYIYLRGFIRVICVVDWHFCINVALIISKLHHCGIRESAKWKYSYTGWYIKFVRILLSYLISRKEIVCLIQCKIDILTLCSLFIESCECQIILKDP